MTRLIKNFLYLMEALEAGGWLFLPDGVKWLNAEICSYFLSVGNLPFLKGFLAPSPGFSVFSH